MGGCVSAAIVDSRIAVSTFAAGGSASGDAAFASAASGSGGFGSAADGACGAEGAACSAGDGGAPLPGDGGAASFDVVAGRGVAASAVVASSTARVTPSRTLSPTLTFT